jgi:hypothetical protein
VLLPPQLAKQLEKVKAARTALTLQNNQYIPIANVSLEQAEKTVNDFCAEAASNLASFTDHEWQELLRTIIRSIRFFGDRLLIDGRIPLCGTGPGVELTVETQLVSSV